MKLAAPKRILNENGANEKGVMIYNGRNYAVGLLWFTVQEDTAKELLKQRVSKSGADFYCSRTHVSQQQGFGWLNRGHRRGMQAAAAMIADQLVGEWHGVFEAENGWWYVQVRSDTITPNGDRFFTSEEEAYLLFQEEATKNIWPHSYAPEKWHINEANTRELKLGNFLDGLSSTLLMPTNLTASFGSTGIRNIVIGSLAFVFVLMIFVAVKSLFQEPVVVPQTPVPARIVLNPRTPDKLKEPNQSVSPQQLLQQCGDAADQLYVSLPGWQLKSFTCIVGKATMTWMQNDGTLSIAKNIGAQVWPKNAAITFNNRVLMVGVELGNLPKLERSELVPQEVALLYLEQNLQPLGPLQVKPVIPPQPAPKNNSSNPNPPPPPPPVPPYLDIVFTTGYGPEKVSPLLTAPALEINQVLWDINQSKWQYKLKWTTQPVKQVAKPTNAAAVKKAPVAGGK
jgi:hypothetical protein